MSADGTLTTTGATNNAAAHQSAPVQPLVVDLTGARVGVVLGSDDFFPEMAVALAKQGADIIATTAVLPTPPSPEPANAATVLELFTTRANDVVHLIAMTDTAGGFIVTNGGGYIDTSTPINTSTGSVAVALDSSKVRQKFLNTYYDFDIWALLNQIIIDTAGADLAATRAGSDTAAIQARLSVDEATHALPPGLSHPLRYTPGDRILQPDTDLYD
ncbi:MAG: hypothetical protein AAFY28_17745 [Actinomycetota bacterium]